jgi:hypothetical protein
MATVTHVYQFKYVRNYTSKKISMLRNVIPNFYWDEHLTYFNENSKAFWEYIYQKIIIRY